MAPRRMKVAHIPFDSEFNKSKLNNIEHVKTITVNGVLKSTHEICQVLSEEAGPYEILKFFQQFARVRNALGWSDGPKLFYKFPEHLHGVYLDLWEDQVEDINTSTTASFDTELALFKAELLDGYTYGNQIAYLRALRKPGKMSPKTFLLKLKSANRLVKSLPGAPDDHAGFSDDELKRRFLEAMPNSWIDKFHDAGMSLEKTSLVDIKRYMELQNLKDPYVDKKDKEQNSLNDQNRSYNNQNGSNNRCGNRGGNHNHNRSGNGNGYNRNSNASGCSTRILTA
mmetsp:Transcript_14459/g.22590  ORF Transcript_14459/g.22590 Transcript_14459/m.22590 type:complete len:283 (+) Transcript_14459:152-1000(+)